VNSNLEEKSGFQIKLFANTFHTNTQKEEERNCFCTFKSEVLVLILGALMSAIFEVVGVLYSFCKISGKQN